MVGEIRTCLCWGAPGYEAFCGGKWLGCVSAGGAPGYEACCGGKVLCWKLIRVHLIQGVLCFGTCSCGNWLGEHVSSVMNCFGSSIMRSYINNTSNLTCLIRSLFCQFKFCSCPVKLFLLLFFLFL